jgi:hypothetical protein
MSRSSVSYIWCPDCYLQNVHLFDKRERERRKSITYCRFFLYSNERHEIVIERIFILFLFLWFSISLSPEWREEKRKRDANSFRLFVLSLFFSHDDSTWMNEWIECIASAAVFLFSFLNQNKRIQHRWRSSCLISRRWLSMLWACHLIHKSSKCR